LGDLECLHKACQAAITDGGLFTDTGVDERCENEGLFKKKYFDFRLKLMRGQGKKRRRISSSAE